MFKKNNVFLNTSVYTVGNVLLQAVAFILLPLYTRYLTPSDYGILASMQVLQTILAILFSLCLNRSIVRLYWDFKTDDEKKNFLGTITLSLIFISLLILFLLLICRKYLGQIYTSIDFYPFYFYAILIGFLTVYSHVPKIYLIIKEKAIPYVLISFSQFIINSSLIVWFIVKQGDGAAGYLKGQLIGNAILIPVYLVISYRAVNFRFVFSMFKESLWYSLPIIPTIMCAWVLNLSDRIFLERYFSMEDVGIYSLGYKIAGLVLILTGAYNQAYSPIFFKFANSLEQDTAKHKLYRYNHTYNVITILICFFLSFFAKEVIVLVFDSRYEGAHYFVSLIAFSYMFSQFDGITGMFFQQSKKMKQNMIKVICIAGLNIGLNFLLIPRMGAYGAAYATILSMMVLFIVSYFYTRKFCYFIPFYWKQLMPLILLLITVTIIFNSLSILGIFLSLMLKIMTVSIISIIFIKKSYLQIKKLITGEI